MKEKVHILLHQNQLFLKFIYALIILNVVALILQSYQEINSQFGHFFEWLELFSVMVFTIEYGLRLWTADLVVFQNKKPLNKRVQFILSPLGLIDLIAILPFYLPMIFPFDLRIVRILRLFRLLRIFKLGRFSKSFKTIAEILKETKSELAMTFFIAFVLLILSSTLMYYIEFEAQPDKFASIGHSFWWAIATLTTVGYGDVYPITPIGKVISAVIALIGIGFVALPTAIISSAFIDKIQKEKNIVHQHECECPNCGTKFTPRVNSLPKIN